MAVTVEDRTTHAGNGRVGQLQVSEAFRGPGFRYARYFLLLILLVGSLLVALVGVLSWYMGMDVTVQGRGVIEPTQRHHVKAELAGIIKDLHVDRWQRVVKGDRIVTLDDTEWRTKLQKMSKELQANQSRKAEVETQIRQEREILKAEVDRAFRERETLALQLEQVRKEYQLYYATYPRLKQPVDDLLPVRLRRTMLQRTEADLERAQKRLDAVEGRKQEIRTLDRIWEKLEQDRLLLNHRLERTVIRAPVAGTVLTGDLHRRIGDRLQPGEAILELAELGGWQAKIMVREIDIPKVKPGQPARLYIDAFPHMEYRIFEGAVEEISAKPAPESLKAAEPLYPVIISVLNPEVSEGERVYSLAYGMRLEAKVVVERGRILDLIWRKLLRTAGKVTRHDLYLMGPE